MSVEGLNHLYFETHSFEKSRLFWEGLGFKLTTQWGDQKHQAGLFQSQQTSVVISEVAQGDAPGFNVHLSISDPDRFAKKIEETDSVNVVESLHDSHWGSQLIRVQDPDGRTICLEAPKV